jgi:4-alpha-glucanotransferase
VVEGAVYEARLLRLPIKLPWGYHRLSLSFAGDDKEVMLISAPFQAWNLPKGREKIWGCFVPLYALHSQRSLGSGDFGDLEAFSNWVERLGGCFVATLPFLAAFLDEPMEPSPYQPVSRLFWNEFYLDVSQLEEVQKSREARDFLNSKEFQDEAAFLRKTSFVDYRRVMALKRKVFAICAREFYNSNVKGQAELATWVAGKREVLDYARFRAAVEKRRAGWTAWPARMRDGFLKEGDYDREVAAYHLYVQWQAHRQFQSLAKGNLYLDLPLGVHREGYDVWRYRRNFCLAASSGAPPDAFFREGQDWGFPPLHPEGIREDGYRYYIACLRHHLRHAGILRLDHVMGLHHLFWIPKGLTAAEGVYVRYHAEEFYAILALESRRHKALLVGEDLGTVPGYVRRAMERHKVNRMYILATEYTGKPSRALAPVRAGCLAGLNTHDMPPFASFWRTRRPSKGGSPPFPVSSRFFVSSHDGGRQPFTWLPSLSSRKPGAASSRQP